MPVQLVAQQPLRAKLIFNATSGRPGESPQQLVDILTEMQNQQIVPEVFIVQPESHVEAVVRSAIRRGIKLIVVAGGDGTIDMVANIIAGSSATLGIIPTGTRNNVAYNLGIPSTIAGAVATLREGRQLKIDIGSIHIGRTTHRFLEAASLGLITNLYPAADNIQHGDLGQIGTLLAAFATSTPSELRMILNGHEQLSLSAYMVLIANMPYIGPNFQISPDVSWNDGQLDVFVFSDMSKLDLIAYAMQSTAGGAVDTRIKHYQVRQLRIHSEPQMPVLADGVLLSQGTVTALAHPGALTVLGGTATTERAVQPGIAARIDEALPDG